jgi:hypothetical protein
MMGSVDISFLGSKNFVDGGLHCACDGRALTAVAVIAVEIPAISAASVASRRRGGRRT